MMAYYQSQGQAPPQMPGAMPTQPPPPPGGMPPAPPEPSRRVSFFSPIDANFHLNV